MPRQEPEAGRDCLTGCEDGSPVDRRSTLSGGQAPTPPAAYRRPARQDLAPTLMSSSSLLSNELPCPIGGLYETPCFQSRQRSEDLEDTQAGFSGDVFRQHGAPGR